MGSEPTRARRHVGRLASIAACVLAWSTAAHAEVLTFQLSIADVLASVGRYNAFLSSDRQAHGVKLVPGGTLFAGQTCAAFGDVYRIGAVTMVADPGRLSALVTTRHGRDAAKLAAVFARAGVLSWPRPAADPETSLTLWSATQVPDGLRFASEGLTSPTGAGLLGAADGAGILRFRVNVPGSGGPTGRYRFLIEMRGRTPTQENGLVVFADRRCFTFVDLEPVDLVALQRLVAARIASGQVAQALQGRLGIMELALARRDTALALDTLAILQGHLIGRTPELVPPDVSRQVLAATFRVRRGIEFHPALAVCGNGVRETGEACDGQDLAGFDCTQAGFASGTLTCLANCRLDTSGCVANAVCGNGLVDIGEECDAGAANSDTVPDACRTTCQRAFCGDGVIDLFEDCEGNDLAGETCKTLGYDGGSLRCDSEFCEFDEDRCTESSF